MSHLRYLWYVIRHKWFVLLACLKLRVPLHQAIIHDWQKFLPCEWFPYVAYFYGNYPKFDPNDSGKWVRRGYYGPTTRDIQPAFDRAWLHHQHYGPHHWQHWLLREDDGDVKALAMPERFVREMVADWIGAGQALGKGKNDAYGWYQAHKAMYVVHPDTQRQVEALLNEVCRGNESHCAERPADRPKEDAPRYQERP